MRFPHDPGLEMQVARLFKELMMPCLKSNTQQKSEGGGAQIYLQTWCICRMPIIECVHYVSHDVYSSLVCHISL